MAGRSDFVTHQIEVSVWQGTKTPLFISFPLSYLSFFFQCFPLCCVYVSAPTLSDDWLCGRCVLASSTG